MRFIVVVAGAAVRIRAVQFARAQFNVNVTGLESFYVVTENGPIEHLKQIKCE